MFLSAPDIRKLIAAGEIVVEPPADPDDVRPVGLRVHLGEELLVPVPGQTADLGGGTELRFDPVAIPPGGYRLKPGGFVLASMREKMKVPCDIVCHLEGRSTLARLGLTVHVTSGVLDGVTCASARVTFELANLGPFEIILRPGAPVGMVTFSKLTSPVQETNPSKYGYSAVEGPKLD